VIDTGADGCLFEKKKEIKKTFKGVGKIQQHSYRGGKTREPLPTTKIEDG
jgi:hypothetical protein